RVLSESEISNLFNSGNGKRVTFVESNLYFVRNDGTEIAITKHISQDGLNYIISSKKTIVQSEELEVEGDIKGKSIHASENAIVDGNIGIGTSSPTVKLDVNGKIKAHEIEIAGKVKSDSLEVSSANISSANISGNAKIDGNLGIGKNPGSKLDVNGKINASQLELTGNVIATNIGSVFTRWGNGTAPSGTELLYSGFGYDAYYNHYGGGSEPLCIPPVSGGTSSSGSTDNLYPIRTGVDLQGIANGHAIKCAVVYTKNPVFENIGSSSCPNGWSPLYSGYIMGPHYNHKHSSSRKCVEKDNFDASQDYNDNGAMYWYGTIISNTVNSNYSSSKYLECAVCAKQ
ncbi:short-chain collagen C4, partial [Candidatus Magnetomorum sp. HK-1]